MSYRISEDLMQRDCGEHAIRCLRKRRIYGGVGRRAHNEWVNVARVVDLACFIRVEEDAITTTKYGLVTQSICQANPRREGLPGCVCRVGPPTVTIETITRWSYWTSKAGDCFGSQVFIGKAQPPARVRPVEPEHLVVLLGWYRSIIPSQAKVQG